MCELRAGQAGRDSVREEYHKRDLLSGGIMNRRTVLIIDDHEEEREIFSRYLEFVGAHVLQAADGEEGLHKARELLPDLILLDLRMPVLDGWQTIERLQLEPATASIPVIALTAHHLESDELERLGFCAYLEKPIVPHRVLEEVERCIGRLDLFTANAEADVLAEPPPADSAEAHASWSPTPIQPPAIRSPRGGSGG
jgi:two-component system, cell cycle response regulator DivK